MRRALVLLLSLAACSPPTDPPATTIKLPTVDAPPAAPSLRPLDTLAAAKLAQAIGTVAPEYQIPIAARGLAELERGRLGDPLVDALDAIAAATSTERSHRIAGGLDDAEASAGWTHACTGAFPDVARQLATLAAGERVPLIQRSCPAGLARLRAAGPEVSDDALTLVLALVTLGALERGGPLDPGEHQALVTLATARAVQPVPADSPTAP